MGKLFDSVISNSNTGCSLEISEYLLERDFSVDTMNPKFLDGLDYENLTIGKPCLLKTCCISNRYFYVYINNKDIYYELETSWGSYCSSRRYDATEYDTVEKLDELLDEIVLSLKDSRYI